MGVDRLGLKEGALFIYSTKNLSSTEKVKFHYSLKGRNGSIGFLKKVKGDHVSSSVVFIPGEYRQDAIDFFNRWNISFEEKDILMRDSGLIKNEEN